MITICRTIRWYNNYIDEVRDNVAEVCNDYIYKDRLTKPHDLQKTRTEQGRLYREQQFGEKIT